MNSNPKYYHIDLTPEQYAELKVDKVSDKDIAASLFVGVATLGRWKRRNDIKAQRDTKDYLELKEQGYSDDLICLRWNIVTSSLHHWKRRRGLTQEYPHRGRKRDMPWLHGEGTE